MDTHPDTYTHKPSHPRAGLALRGRWWGVDGAWLEAEPLGSPLNRRRAVPAAYRPRDLAAALDADLTLRENKKKRSSEDDDV